MSTADSPSSPPSLNRIFRAAFELSSRPMVVTDAAGQPLHLNPAAGELAEAGALRSTLATAAAALAAPGAPPRWFGTIGLRTVEVVRLSFRMPDTSVLLCIVDAPIRTQLNPLAPKAAPALLAEPVANEPAPVMVWSSAADARRLWIGPAFALFTGTPHEPVAHSNGWLGAVHAEDVDRCAGIYRACFDAGMRYSMDYRLRRHDGGHRWVMDSGEPQRDAHGTLLGYTGACVDIHDRRLLEEQLAERMLKRRDGTAAAATAGALQPPPGSAPR